MKLESLVQSTKNLERKGRNWLAASLLGLSAAGTEGCATIGPLSEGEELTLLSALMAESEDSVPARLAPYVYLLGQMRHQKEVVREGRTEVNVNLPENVIRSNGRYYPAPGFTWANPGNPEDFSVRGSIGAVFAANYWRDFDNNGFVEPNEFVGIKNKFYGNENIILVLYGSNQQFERQIRWEIYNPRGEKILRDSLTTAYGNINIGQKFNLMNFLLERGGYGNYVVVWNSQGITETKEFEILPSTREK